MYLRHIISSFSHHILTQISSLLLSHSPLIGLHIVKIYIFARVRHVASDRIGKKHAIVYSNVLYCNVADRHSWLSLADSLTKRVKHAPGTVSVGFFHLLRTDVNRPPNRFVHCEVLEI